VKSINTLQSFSQLASFIKQPSYLKIMSNFDEINKMSNPIIKGKRPIYFFISDDGLKNLKNDSIVGDITFALFSLAIATSISKNDWIYSLFGLAFLSVSIYFYVRKHKSISETRSSGEVESYEFKENRENKNQLLITKATYGTPPNKTVDRTNLLNDKIKDGKLFLHIDNINLECEGDKDPDKGINKVLDIEYSIGNNLIKKHYREYEDIVLP
jgi:hypothetical protein